MVEGCRWCVKNEDPTQTKGQLVNGEMQMRGDGRIERRPGGVWLWDPHLQGFLKTVLLQGYC